MKYKLIVISLIFNLVTNTSYSQPSLKFELNQTLTWEETIRYYEYLDNRYPNTRLEEAGTTDSGKPLHLFLISSETIDDFKSVKRSGKTMILINNGIHPGEPCGVDASILFAEEILDHPDKYEKLLENTLIGIIPILNVGGALNRSSFHRANQNGPMEQGFRGNSQNMNLNRDFIKMDTRNVRSMVRIMREWDPDILVDTHTSNGADYPYVLTLIATQRDKLNPPLSAFLYDEMLPVLFSKMEETPYDMIPYVMSRDYRNPENGIVAFMDCPRYTTGYASLFGTIGFTTESHMFKKFSDRVLATYHFLMSVSEYAAENNEKIQTLRELTKEHLQNKRTFVTGWELDTSYQIPLDFKGYTMETGISDLTGQPDYHFNRDDMWEKEIPYYTAYKPVNTITAPDIYIVPSAWEDVIERLLLNRIEYSRLRKDTILRVEYYYIEEYNTARSLNNGHYKHYATKTRTEIGYIRFLEGDYLIPLNQPSKEYLVQSLEPVADDSFFNWNFFDAILSRKEYFSPYVFEEKAKELLARDPHLAKEFAIKKQSDAEFASDHYAQFRFLYEHSLYAEDTYKRYPVARMFLDRN